MFIKFSVSVFVFTMYVSAECVQSNEIVSKIYLYYSQQREQQQQKWKHMYNWNYAM